MESNLPAQQRWRYIDVHSEDIDVFKVSVTSMFSISISLTLSCGCAAEIFYLACLLTLTLLLSSFFTDPWGCLRMLMLKHKNTEKRGARF